MRVLLPINRFRVTFRTAVGVPHSQFESLILASIAASDDTLDDLERTFAIHRRLLVQSLVGLIQQGFVALGPNDRFLLTDEGQAVADGKDVPQTRISPERSTTVIMERRLGLVARSHEVRFVGRRELDDLHAQPRVPRRRHERTLDPAQVRHLLPRDQKEWIRSVEDVRLIQRDASWLPVRLDHERGTISGVPDRWTNLLAPVLLEDFPPSAASARSDSVAHLELPAPRAGDFDRLAVPGATVTELDVVHGRDSFAFLRNVLDRAERTLAIASPITTLERLDALRPALTAAAERGLEVHVLAQGADEAVSRELQRLQYDLQDLRVSTMSTQATGSLASLIWREEDAWHLAIGGVEWLRDEPTGTSITLRTSGLVSTTADLFAGAWAAGPNGNLSNIPEYWRSVASDRGLQFPSESGTKAATATESVVRVVMGGEADQIRPLDAEANSPWMWSEPDRCALGWTQRENTQAVAVEVVGPCANNVGALTPG